MGSLRHPTTLAAVAGLALVAAGCGGGGSAKIDQWIGPEAVITRTVTTTVAPAAADPTPDANGETRSPASQQYTIRPGDSVSAIANRFGIEMDALVGINDWPSANEAVLIAGEVIDIPPNALVPNAGSSSSASNASSSSDDDEDDAAAEDDDADDDSASSSGTAGTCPDGSDAEEHEIVSGDNPSKVAAANSVTLDELRAANEGNSAMTSFIVGQTIYLPC